jgi:hypothetical protein
MAEPNDTATSIALNSAAPASERYDAQLDLHKSSGPRGLGDLIPSDEIRPVIDFIQQDLEEQAWLKSIRDDDSSARARTERGSSNEIRQSDLAPAALCSGLAHCWRRYPCVAAGRAEHR